MKKHKSVDLVIKAFHHAFNDSQAVRLRIAGDGEERNKLEWLIRDLGEENRIELIGRYSREEPGSLFSSADAFVLTSQVEPFGIVYIEAMMAGLPCIGTRGQGADDIITAENGLLVDYGDVRQLAQAMKNMMENCSSYESEAIRVECLRRFSPETVCGMIETIYEDVKGAQHRSI